MGRKINFSDYSVEIAKAWVEAGTISEPLAQVLIKQAALYIDGMLLCNKCKQMFPDEDFYKQPSQQANRGRAQKCKPCHREAYPQGRNR